MFNYFLYLIPCVYYIAIALRTSVCSCLLMLDFQADCNALSFLGRAEKALAFNYFSQFTSENCIYCLLSKSVLCWVRAGVKELKFVVKDTRWYEKQEAIRSLDLRYNAIWNAKIEFVTISFYIYFYYFCVLIFLLMNFHSAVFLYAMRLTKLLVLWLLHWIELILNVNNL